MKNTLYLNWKANPSKGEVFTPIGLVRMILDKIPNEVWTNPNSIFIDPCMGKGVFLIEIVRRLVDIYGYSEEDAKSRVFGYDIRVKYVNYLKRRGYKNVFHKDSLKELFKMKFDVVLGNPPYQKETGAANAENLWPKFVQKSFEICKDGGYVSLIHPSGWRNVSGEFKNTQELIKSKQVKYIEIHDEKDGMKIFNATTSFDWYVIKNIESDNLLKTTIKGFDGKIDKINIKNLQFIPNGNFSTISSLIANDNQERVQILSNSSYHHQRKYMSKIKTENHIYPCVYSIIKGEIINLIYSNTKDKGHFGIPKVIWSNGMASPPIVDENGKYGLTQYAYAIVDDVKNLTEIKRVMESDVFLNLITYCYMSNGDRFNRKILATFRKNFWKEFLDEEGNIIEPNFNQNVEQL
jgi:hypothetical protein